MARPRRSLLFVPLAIMAFAILGGVFGPGLTGVSAATASSPEEDLKSSIKSFTKVYDVVEQNFADQVNPDKAIYKGAIPGMLRTLDPHSNFFDPKDYRSAPRRPARPLLRRRHDGAAAQRQDHGGGAVRRLARLQSRACARAT